MKTFDQIIQAVREDQTSGSSHLVETLLGGLIGQVHMFSEKQKLDAIKQIELLHQEKPFFAVLGHLVERLKLGFDKDSLTGYVKEIDQIQDEISNQFLAKTKPRSKVFLLHSHSETIMNTFSFIASEGVKPFIFQTMSEPQREGIIQATRLKKLGFKVEMIEDNVDNSFIDRLDYFVTGADLIYPDSIMNKSGTLKIAEQVIKNRKSYVVLADYRKFTSTKIKHVPDGFEVVPHKLITELITGQ
jgi:translation initiation factor 2B subunit (eIF-2B alpha/beta/delta family)